MRGKHRRSPRGGGWPLGVAALLVFAGSGVAAADDDTPSLPLRGPISFEAFDLDGNGVISEEEFESVHRRRDEMREQEGLPPVGRRRAFADLDGDGDGAISREELRAGQGAGRGGPGRGPGPGGGRGMGMRGGRGMGGGPPPFSDFDLNGDGRIEEPEFAEARAARVAARAEEGRMLRGMATAPPFAEFDTDGDGSLTQEEFAAGVRRRWEGMDDGAQGGVEP